MTVLMRWRTRRAVAGRSCQTLRSASTDLAGPTRFLRRGHLLVECRFAGKQVSRGSGRAMAIRRCRGVPRPRVGSMRWSGRYGDQQHPEPGRAHGEALAGWSWSAGGRRRDRHQAVFRSGRGAARLRLVRDGTLGAPRCDRGARACSARPTVVGYSVGYHLLASAYVFEDKPLMEMLVHPLPE